MAVAEYLGYRERSRDINELFRRGVWGEMAYGPTGAIMSVRGTDANSADVPVINLGYAFNLPNNSNAEVFMLAQGSDTNQRFALPTIPRDLQHHWGEGEGGIQHPTDPNRRIEFNADETWLKDGDYILGNNRELSISISGGTVTISVNGDLILAADSVDIQSSKLTHNGVNVGDDHVHDGVDRGNSKTDGPE